MGTTVSATCCEPVSESIMSPCSQMTGSNGASALAARSAPYFMQRTSSRGRSVLTSSADLILSTSSPLAFRQSLPSESHTTAWAPGIVSGRTLASTKRMGRLWCERRSSRLSGRSSTSQISFVWRMTLARRLLRGPMCRPGAGPIAMSSQQSLCELVICVGDRTTSAFCLLMPSTIFTRRCSSSVCSLWLVSTLMKFSLTS